MSDVVNDPFHRALKFALEEQISHCTNTLAAGSAALTADEHTSVAEKYAAAVSRIRTFLDVLSLCEMIEKNMLDVGARPGKVDVVER